MIAAAHSATTTPGNSQNSSRAVASSGSTGRRSPMNHQTGFQIEGSIERRFTHGGHKRQTGWREPRASPACRLRRYLPASRARSRHQIISIQALGSTHWRSCPAFADLAADTKWRFGSLPSLTSMRICASPEVLSHPPRLLAELGFCTMTRSVPITARQVDQVGLKDRVVRLCRVRERINRPPRVSTARSSWATSGDVG